MSDEQLATLVRLTAVAGKEVQTAGGGREFVALSRLMVLVDPSVNPPAARFWSRGDDER